MTPSHSYDFIVVGAGASGLIAAIHASMQNQKVLLLEQLPKIGSKLKATGGGRCNLSNTLNNENFMKAFGKNGRFMQEALNHFDSQKLRKFFESLGVETHIPDGFRIFPTTHNSQTILDAFSNALKNNQVTIQTQTEVIDLIIQNNSIIGVQTPNNSYFAPKVLIATGGKGYPKLGATAKFHAIVEKYGHTVTKLYPAMMPLLTKESWQGNCTSHTIAKATIKVNLANKKLQKLQAKGDLIFTKNGLRGPVILDFAREITPFLEEFDEVPILVNLTAGMNENEILEYLKKHNGFGNILPKTVLEALCKMCDINPNSTYKELQGNSKDTLIKLLAWTPFTIIGHEGFSNAMITRGGIKLQEIDPKTMQSKIIQGLHFAGEIIDLDGPCGGYNLQWAFSSGFLASSIVS